MQVTRKVLTRCYEWWIVALRLTRGVTVNGRLNDDPMLFASSIMYPTSNNTSSLRSRSSRIYLSELARDRCFSLDMQDEETEAAANGLVVSHYHYITCEESLTLNMLALLVVQVRRFIFGRSTILRIISSEPKRPSISDCIQLGVLWSSTDILLPQVF